MQHADHDGAVQNLICLHKACVKGASHWTWKGCTMQQCIVDELCGIGRMAGPKVKQSSNINSQPAAVSILEARCTYLMHPEKQRNPA